MNLNPTIKESQQEILVILKEFDRICRKNGIKYSLHGGTLLGAVREKGFIPWDDDADVVMMREEYEKLARCIGEESKEFRLTTSFLPLHRIVRKNYEEDTVLAWLDVMTYDYISGNRILRCLKMAIILGFQAMCRDKQTIHLSEGKNHSTLQMILFKIAYFVGKPFSYEKKLQWYESFCKKCLCGKKEYMHRSNDQLRGLKLVLPVKYMKNYQYLPFEDTRLMVTENYHEILVNSYGNDYMTPKRDMANENMHVDFKKIFLMKLNQSE